MPPGAVVHIRTGWAVLTIRAVVARWVWERYPFLGPGGMSLLKSAMVSNETLAAFCVHIGLHKHLQLSANDLSSSIQKYVDFLEELRKKEYEFAARENRLPGQYWIDLPLPAPKVRTSAIGHSPAHLTGGSVVPSGCC